MEEKTIKIILIVVILAAVIAAIIIPRSGLRKYLRMNETLFVTTNVLGTICGLAGLVLSIIMPATVIRLHLWELIILPFALIYMYWLMIADAQKKEQVLDEKQEFNMSGGAVVSWCVSIVFMGLVFSQYQNGNLSGGVWFLLFFFQTLTVFSAATLYFYKYK
ncbi:MAG TPA: hypothetical protein ENK44_17270 [Caldithrix abyssi]|uniref:Uncharacterized protein n=1 Tax=Caldithrix abyssi TaxID=187145 RepID=A0A7V4U3P0_CALAY|nr:hypothetical protein [Caldithrix abyssi]